MRVAVINPWVTDYKLYDEWMHPLGLYFLSSLLRHNGIEVLYFNCLRRSAENGKFGTGDFPSVVLSAPTEGKGLARYYKRYGVPPVDLERFLTLTGPLDAVFVGTAMTYWIDGVCQTVEQIRKSHPATPIIVGGVAARLIPEVIRRLLPTVHVYQGSLHEEPIATSAIPLLSRLSFRGWSASMVQGFELLDHCYHGPILLSRGCPLNCAYCAAPLFEPNFARRPLPMVLEETEYLYHRFGIRDFAFYDDALLYCEPSLSRFLETVRSKGLSLRLHAPNGVHLQKLTPALAHLLRSAGCVTLRFGYETSHAGRKNLTGNKVDRDRTRNAIQTAREAGFSGREIGAYVMAGLPMQNPMEVVEEIRFIASLGIKSLPVFLSPVPGTALFREYTEPYPDILHNPIAHNDILFTRRLRGWDDTAIELIRREARIGNSMIPV